MSLASEVIGFLFISTCTHCFVLFVLFYWSNFYRKILPHINTTYQFFVQLDGLHVCVLVCFSWLLNHMIYLKLRKKLSLQHCNPVQGQYREKPVFRSWDPCHENRFLPVGNTTQGKPCFHYRDGFAVKLSQFNKMMILFSTME